MKAIGLTVGSGKVEIKQGSPDTGGFLTPRETSQNSPQHTDVGGGNSLESDQSSAPFAGGSKGCKQGPMYMGRLFKIAGVLAGLWLLVIGTMILVGPKEDAGATADVAIVLGAAIEGDQPSPVFRERILHGIALWRSGRVQRILFTGGFGRDLNIAESEVARRFALAQGVPAIAILSEAKSRTTQQNLVEAQEVMKSAGLSSALIVSDPLHLYRSMAMAKRLNLPARPNATPSTQYRSLSTKLPFFLREFYFVHHYWVLGE